MVPAALRRVVCMRLRVERKGTSKFLIRSTELRTANGSSSQW